MKTRTFFILLILFTLCCSTASAQSNFSISLESNSQKYFDDNGLGIDKPVDSWGSNNFMNLNYYYKNLTIGLQVEAYLPSTQAYFNRSINNADITNKFISYETDNLGVTVGNFYEQFGNGLIFRSYQERQLGIDNSVFGLLLRYKLTDDIYIKALTGKAKNKFEFSNGTLRGLDLTIPFYSLTSSKFFRNIDLGASFVNKYEDNTSSVKEQQKNVSSYAARLNYNEMTTALSFEYVKKGAEHVLNMENNEYINNQNAGALFASVSQMLGDVNITGTFRRLESMEYRSERKATNNDCMINYLPALTKQNKYSLANVFVYSTQMNSEIGYQVDAFYKIPKKTFLGGKYGVHVAVNYSNYHGLDFTDDMYNTNFISFDGEKLFEEASIEITKKWNRKLKTVLLFDYSDYNKPVLQHKGEDMVQSRIFVSDILYKFNDSFSLRSELQHLATNDEDGDWAACLFEFNFPPHLSFFIGDDYNYGHENKLHYYNCGFSYTKNALQMMMSYGRTKGGINCVGGICKFVPNTKALSLNIIHKF